MRNRRFRWRGPILVLALALALALALSPVPAHAVLYAVAHDRTLNHELLVRVSTLDAAITDDAQVALPGCCRVNGSLVASDDVAQTVYFVTPDPDPLLAWRLHRISLASGASVSASLPVDVRIAAILRRPATSTLYALGDTAAGAGLRLVTISDAGVVADVGAPILANCCGVRVGVVALSADASRIAFVARLTPAANDPALRLFVISTATGALISNPVLAHAPDVLYGSGGSAFSAIYHAAGTQYVGAIAGDGSITPVGAGLAGCCGVFAGVAARSGNLVHVVARATGAADLSLYEVDTVTGSFTAIGVLPARYVLNGLVQSNVVLASDLIFRDGFDPVVAVPGVQSDPGLAGKAGAAAMGDFAAGTDADALVGDGPGPGVEAKDLLRPLGGVPPDAVALPLGGPMTWGVLIVVLILVASGFRHRMRWVPASRAGRTTCADSFAGPGMCGMARTPASDSAARTFKRASCRD